MIVNLFRFNPLERSYPLFEPICGKVDKFQWMVMGLGSRCFLKSFWIGLSMAASNRCISLLLARRNVIDGDKKISDNTPRFDFM